MTSRNTVRETWNRSMSSGSGGMFSPGRWMPFSISVPRIAAIWSWLDIARSTASRLRRATVRDMGEIYATPPRNTAEWPHASLRVSTMTDDVLVSQTGGVCELRLNRPEKRNAITLAMYDALWDALVRAEADDSVRAILLSGAGASFTAGNDLSDFVSRPLSGGEHGPVRL